MRPHPPHTHSLQGAGPRRPGGRPPVLAIMETSAVVGILWARHSGRRPPRWFEDCMRGGRIAVPRTVEVELKRLRKSNRRGAGSRGNDLSWLARLKGRDLLWVYDLYRGPPVDAGVHSRIAAMHEGAVRDPGGAAAAAWLRSKRSFVAGRLGRDPSSMPIHEAGRALGILSRAAENDRAIMAQAVAIASAAAPGARSGAALRRPVLVSRDGDFTAFAGPLEEIAGGSMRVVHYSRM